MKRSSKIQSARSQSTANSNADEARAPERTTLTVLRREAGKCRACDLWKNATQTVFGEGSPKAKIMFLGEQPGDQEDRMGHPFVGPAGKLLDEALEEAGIDRKRIYLTNAVKHFKWTASERGKRRIHKKPRASEIKACRPWLEAEMRIVQPQILVALGATAAQALFGANFSVTRQRGQVIKSGLAPFTLATVHPSSILRAPDADARREQMRMFIKDLKRVASLAGSARAA